MNKITTAGVNGQLRMETNGCSDQRADKNIALLHVYLKLLLFVGTHDERLAPQPI